jgi:hypothetical protein
MPCSGNAGATKNKSCYLNGGLIRLLSTSVQMTLLKKGCRAMAAAPSKLPNRQRWSTVMSLTKNKTGVDLNQLRSAR